MGADRARGSWTEAALSPTEVGPTQIALRPVLAALAEPHRADLVRLLVSSGQLRVRDMVAATGMAQPLVSHHLKVLREAGLVESTAGPGLSVYRLRADTLRAMAVRLTALAEQAAATADDGPR